jgi:hypothetical protein
MQLSQNTVFDPGTGYLVAQLEKESYGMPYLGAVQYRGKTFEPKPELHITLISREAAERVQQYLAQHPPAEEQIRKLIEQADWSYQKWEEYFHVAESPDAETIIQMVDMPRLSDFFAGLENIIGAALELPPTHVTLYTYHTEKGIGLPTQAVFRELVQGPVRLQDLRPADDAEQGNRQHG